MERIHRSPSNVFYGTVGIVGAFFLYWGIMSITSPAYVPSVTVPWLDQTLRAVGRYVWMPAAGILLLAVGVSPVIVSGVRRSRVVRIGFGGVVMFPFYKGIVWYIIRQPIASLLSYAMAVPTVVSTIVLGIAGIAAVGILCTLWRAGPTADPFLVSRMVVSLVLLAGVTLAFFAPIAPL